MGFIMDQMVKYVIGTITKVFDIYFYGTFALLGVNLSIFEHVFPIVKKLNVAILTIGIGIAFFIFCFQLIKSFQPSEADEAEAPFSLAASFVTALIYIIAYRPILNIFIEFTSNALSIMGTKNLKMTLSKGLASNMYSSIKDSLVKADNKNFLDKVKDAFDSLIGKQIPQMIVALIVVIYLVVKLYKLSIIVIKNYVGIGILTYLAPLPLATRASKATKSYMTSFLQLYIEHLISVLLNLWFVRIIFGGFTAIDFSSFSKMSDSLESSGIQNAIGNAMNFGGVDISIFAAIFIWAFMIGAFIDYALNLNYYIERLGVGGLTIVPNKNNNQGTLSRLRNRAMSTGVPMAGRVISDSISALGGKKASAADGAMGGKENTSSRGNAGGAGPSHASKNEKAAGAADEKKNETMGSKEKNPTMGSKYSGEKDFSPASDVSKKAGADALLNNKMKGKEAKKNFAAALKGKVLDPNKEGKDYLNQKMEGATRKEKNKLKDSLVFNTGKDGKQIMSNIASDGKGSIHAEMNGENINLKSEGAIKSQFSSPAEANEYMKKCGSMEVGGQKLYYDTSQCPQFHRMMSDIDFSSGKSPNDNDSIQFYDPTQGTSFGSRTDSDTSLKSGGSRQNSSSDEIDQVVPNDDISF